MHRASYMVPAAKVAPKVEFLLDQCTREAVLDIRQACLEGGRIDGKRHDSCFYGTTAKASGRHFMDLTAEQIREDLRQFGNDIGVNILLEDNKLDLIEQYFFEVQRCQDFTTSDVLANLLQWCDGSIDRRDFLKEHPDEVYRNAGEDVAYA